MLNAGTIPAIKPNAISLNLTRARQALREGKDYHEHVYPIAKRAYRLLFNKKPWMAWEIAMQFRLGVDNLERVKCELMKRDFYIASPAHYFDTWNDWHLANAIPEREKNVWHHMCRVRQWEINVGGYICSSCYRLVSLKQYVRDFKSIYCHFPFIPNFVEWQWNSITNYSDPYHSTEPPEHLKEHQECSYPMECRPLAIERLYINKCGCE